MTKLTKMQQFYKDKSIFITGASGFMGKVLLEKLLYSCSDVKQIMILVRPKRGKSAAQRVQDFTALPVSVFCIRNAKYRVVGIINQFNAMFLSLSLSLHRVSLLLVNQSNVASI